MTMRSLPKRLAATALCAAVLAAGSPSWARGAVVCGSLESASSQPAASAAASLDGPMYFYSGSMYSALNSGCQRSCYNALQGISLGTILSSPDHLVPVEVPGATGEKFKGHIVDNELVPADTAAERRYEAVRNDLKAAVIALRYDRPEMLWLDETVSGITELEERDGTVTIKQVYYQFEMPYGGREKELYNGMMAAAKSIAQRAGKEADTYSRVLAAHNIIAAQAKYEHTPDDDLAELLTHSAYSALIGGDSYEPVCDGYSRAFKLVMDQMGIDCVLVSSAGHMWNRVRMEDGHWYNVDLTWDDGRGNGDTTYFLVGSDTKFGSQRFHDQENHIELDPFADAGIDVGGLKYPIADENSYEYIGRDRPIDEEYVPAIYPDVGRDYWAFEEIQAASLAGYFQGDKQGRFKPEAPLTRAQLAQMMANKQGVDLADYEDAEQIYADVPTGAWYAPAVAWAHETGLMLGDGNGFRPNDPLSRQEICVVLYRALGLSGDWDESFKFTDHDSIGGWARNQVYACYQAGLIKGNTDGSFAPKASTKRSHAAAIFARYEESKNKGV